MKKLFALLLTLALMLAIGATAFAETKYYMEWNEEHQRYEVMSYEDDSADVAMAENPSNNCGIDPSINWRDLFKDL